MSQINVSDRSTCDPGSQMSTSEKSEEEKPESGSPDNCSGDSQASIINKCSENEKSKVTTTTNKSVREEKPHGNIIEKSVHEPESQTCTPYKSVEQQPQMSTMDNCSELPSQASTIDMPFDKEKSHEGTTNECSDKEKIEVNAEDKCLAEPELQIGPAEESSVLPELQVSTASKSLAEKSQLNSTEKHLGEPPIPVSTTHRSEEETIVNTTDKTSGEPASLTSTTDECSGVKKLHMSTDKSFGGEKSQAHITDIASGEPVSQKSITDMSLGEETPAVNSKEFFLENPESQTGTAEKSPTSTTEKSGDQIAPTSTTDKSGQQESLISTNDKSGDQDSSMDITDRSGEQVSLMGATDNSSGLEPPTNITDNPGEQDSSIGKTDMSGEQVSTIDTPDKSSRLEPPTSITDNSGEQDLPVCTKDKSVEQEAPTSIADNFAEQDSPKGTTDKSGEQVSKIDTPDKSRGQEAPTSIADTSDEQNSPIGTTDKCSGQVLPITITDYSGEQESPMGTTGKSGENSQEMQPHLNSKVKYLGEPISQTATADKSEQELPTSTIGEYSEPELSKSLTDELGYQKSQWSTIDHSDEQVSRVRTTESISKKQEFQEDPTPYPRHRQGLQGGATSEPSPKGETVIKDKPTTGYHWLIVPIISAVVFVVLLYFVLSKNGPSPIHQDSILDIFFKEFARLKKDFPGQNEGLWFRSEKLLQKHLNMSDPSAPSILILTAAQDGEQTLRCVSKRLAKSYADSLSAKWLMVHGPSKSNFDSATSKMQIDEELSSGFQSDSRAAVLDRLETLPPGSLLILYKYCDHENAAFKNVALVLTILLDEQSLEMDLSFTEVEEKVKDFLWERFAYSGVSAHNEMDVDKLSGVWSRISHVVLPILPVGSIENGNCPGI